MPDNLKSAEATETKGWSKGGKILTGIILLVFLIGVLAALTLTIGIMEKESGTSFPYITTYRVTLPDGEAVTIGSSRIIVMSVGNEMVADVDGTREKLTAGQERVINPRHAQITVMGVPLLETDFQISLKYLGTTGKNANFDMTVKTSQQVPEMVLRRLIPANMNAQPV